jgi:MYXO-CTERM domain-containing protein
MTFSRTFFFVGGAALAASLLASAPAHAQAKPFPTSGHYAHGFLPSSVTSAVVQSSYANWKTKYLLTDCGSGYYRVDNATGDASTFSEGQGYGLVITAYMGDKTAFDGLWAFAKKNFNPMFGLMGWHFTCSGFTTSDGGAGSATDGDTDAAMGLLVAAAQWGGTYAQEAMSYLATLKSVDFTTCSPSGRNIATAGNWQGSGACTASGGGSNTSYWMPGYYRVFQAFTGDSFWGKAADDAVDLYNIAADPTTGIIVNEVDQDGVPVSGQTYDYNSCRIPWRAALDYLWWGTAGSQQAVTKITNWANTVGITKIVDGYDGNGTATGQYTGIQAFVGGFAAGASGNSQSVVDTFSTYFVSIDNDNGTYYGSSLRTLYTLMLSGNQWNPLEVLSDAGVPPAGDGGMPVDQGDSGTVPGDDGGVSTMPSPPEDGGPAAQATPGKSSSSGCGCRLASGGSPLVAGAGLVSLLALLAGRRRRR